MDLRDQILKADDLPREPADDEAARAWGLAPGTLCVGVMSGEDRDSYYAGFYDEKGNERADRLENLTARLLVRALVDATGKRIFTNEDMPALGQKSSQVLDALGKDARRLNGIGAEAAKAAAGNSVPSPSGGSPSG
jgi:hypothetical protein